jgi:hypothetical protein
MLGIVYGLPHAYCAFKIQPTLNDKERNISTSLLMALSYIYFLFYSQKKIDENAVS